MKIKTKIVSSHTADFKPVKQEVNSTVILPPLVFPAGAYKREPLLGLNCNGRLLALLTSIGLEWN